MEIGCVLLQLQLKKRLTELRNQNDKASMAMNEIKIRERKVTVSGECCSGPWEHIGCRAGDWFLVLNLRQAV